MTGQHYDRIVCPSLKGKHLIEMKARERNLTPKQEHAIIAL